MERGEVPPNWEDLYRFSKELATEAEFTLAREWLESGSTVLEGGDSRPLVMPDTGAPDSAVQDAITDPFDIMPDEDGVDRCKQNETVKNVTLQPSDRSRDRVQLSRLLTPRVRKELELQDGVVGTAGQSKSAESQRITRRQAQS